MKRKFFVFLALLIALTTVSSKNKSNNVFQNPQPLVSKNVNYNIFSFIENQGQFTDITGNPVPFVMFKMETPGMNIYITEKGLTYVFHSQEKIQEQDKLNNHSKDILAKKISMAWINLHLTGARIKKENIIMEDPSSSYSNYFYPHCQDGIYNVASYKKIIVKDIYPRIDWILYGSSKTGMKYDFIVHPGADPSQIKMVYESETPLETGADGNLLIRTKLGNLTEHAPYSYTYENRSTISSSFIAKQLNKNSTEVSFKLGHVKNKFETLVIDPQLTWSTLIGGNGYEIFSSTETDINDNVFITGSTTSTNFPPLNPANGFNFFQTAISTPNDIIILKFDNTGVLLWSTYYGGNNGESGADVKADATGNIYITGLTLSTNFPVQNLAGAYNQASNAGTTANSRDAFILKFNSTNCQLLWATYFGGNGSWDYGTSLAIDIWGNFFLTGSAESGFPLQPNGAAYYQPTINTTDSYLDGFIAKFNSFGAILWSTFYGGRNYEHFADIGTDQSGNVYVTGDAISNDLPVFNMAGAYNQSTNAGGNDGFILKFDNAGVQLWATYFGGNNGDLPRNIVCDSQGNIFITGVSYSPLGFPTLNPLGNAYYQGTMAGGFNQDMFILKFNSLGALTWSTFYGGTDIEELWICNDALLVDPCDNIYISFFTKSTDIPTQNSCGFFNGTFGGGSFSGDCFLAQFSNSGMLLWATYLGGDSNDDSPSLAIDSYKNIFVAYRSFLSTNLPLVDPGGGAYFDNVSNGGNQDGVICKMTPILPTYSQQQTEPACVCNGVATINLTSCGISPYNYRWSNGNQTLNSTSLTNTLSSLCAGTYSVVVESNCMVKDTFNFTLILSADTSSSFSNQLICSTDSLFAAGAWQKTNGTYLDTLTNAAGCDSIIMTNLTITSPSAAVSGNMTITRGNSVMLTASGGITYMWSPSAGLSCPTCSNPTLYPTGTTTYTVIISDALGCTSMATVRVDVEDKNCETPFLPDAFSPNEDGVNDQYCIYNTNCIKTMNLEIYNRWGEKLFITTNPEFCWNGYFKGNQLNSSVLVYSFTAILLNGEGIHMKGNISLIK